MVSAQGKAYKGHPGTTAPYFPFVAPAPLGKSGAFIGTCMRSGRLVYLDPPQLMNERVINGQVAQVIAPRDHGKTTFMKSVCGVRMLAVQAGSLNGSPRKARLLVDDRKPEVKEEVVDGVTQEIGRGEYYALGEFTGARFLELSKMPSINIFHPNLGLKPHHALELAVKVCEQDKGDRLTPIERQVLLIAVNKMYASYELVASPGMLELCLDTYNAEDRQNFFKTRDKELLRQHARTLVHEPELKLAIEKLMARQYGEMGESREERNRRLEDMQFAAADLAIYLHNMQADGVIGNEYSLLDLLTSRRAVWDWTGVNRRSRMILEFLRQIAQELSLSRSDLDIIAHVRLGDEERSASDELIHLRHRLEYVEKARAFPTFDVTSVQFEHGLAETAGAVGSVERGIVDLINQGTALRFFGKQPYDTEHLHELSKYGIAEHDLYLMTQLEMGCWAVQTGGARRVQWVRHILVPSEEKLVESNAAARRQIARIPFGSLDYRPAIMYPGEIRRMVEEGETVQIEPQE